MVESEGIMSASRTLFLVLVVVSLGCQGPSEESEADLILVNGKIVTVDREFSIHSAMAVKGEHILAVGNEDSLEQFSGPNTQRLDVEGRTVLPGIIDSHMHQESIKLRFG